MRLNIDVWLTALTGWLSFSLPTSASAADNGGPVRDLVFAQAFKLDKSYTHTWRKEQPLVSSGYVLVLAVDPEFVRPKQVAEPVLYVGNQTAERINAADVSGRLVVIVSAQCPRRGRPGFEQRADLVRGAGIAGADRCRATERRARCRFAQRRQAPRSRTGPGCVAPGRKVASLAQSRGFAAENRGPAARVLAE